MRQIFINGEHLCLEHTDGMKRYMMEILGRIDKMIPGSGLKITLYHHRNERLAGVSFDNIKDIGIPGSRKKYRLVNVPACIKAKNGIQCTMANDWITMKDGIFTVHDLIPLHKISGLPVKEKYRMKLIYKMGFMRSKVIVTDTESTKKEFIERYRIDENRIKVFGCGYEHMDKIDEDDSVFERLDGISRGQYYFAIGNQFKYKNFAWITKVAKYNKDARFVIAGCKQPSFRENIESSENVFYAGYVSDGEYKALLKNCIAFIHPSRLEGFGLPPLEAISQGVRAIVSNASCLPEIYGNCVNYLNPDIASVKLDELLKEPVCSSDDLLNKYSWDKVALKWFDMMRVIAKE